MQLLFCDLLDGLGAAPDLFGGSDWKADAVVGSAFVRHQKFVSVLVFGKVFFEVFGEFVKVIGVGVGLVARDFVQKLLANRVVIINGRVDIKMCGGMEFFFFKLLLGGLEPFVGQIKLLPVRAQSTFLL